jgi:hypothetical protein
LGIFPSHKFKLTLGFERAQNLSDFEPFPITMTGTTINPEGEIGSV